MMARKRLRFVEVMWDDAVSVATWVDPLKELPAVTKCVSRGWLLHDDKTQVTLASTVQVSNGSDVGEVLTIPRGMVQKIRTLKV